MPLPYPFVMSLTQYGCNWICRHLAETHLIVVTTDDFEQFITKLAIDISVSAWCLLFAKKLTEIHRILRWTASVPDNSAEKSCVDLVRSRELKLRSSSWFCTLVLCLTVYRSWQSADLRFSFELASSSQVNLHNDHVLLRTYRLNRQRTRAFCFEIPCC